MGNVLDCAAEKPEDDEGKSTSISFDSDEATLLQSGEPVTLQSFTRLCSSRQQTMGIAERFLQRRRGRSLDPRHCAQFCVFKRFLAKCYAKVIGSLQTNGSPSLLVV